MAKKTNQEAGPEYDSMTISDIEGMLRDRKKQLSKLQRRREKLQAELASLDDQIAEMHGSGSALPPGKRPRNDRNLADTIEEVIRKDGKGSKGMKVPQIVEAVERTGYASSSKNFRGIVNQTLIKDDRFKSVSRGVYGLK